MPSCDEKSMIDWCASNYRMGGSSSTPAADSSTIKHDVNANAVPAECPMHNKNSSVTEETKQVQ